MRSGLRQLLDAFCHAREGGHPFRVLLSLITVAVVMLLATAASAQTHEHQHPDLRNMKPRQLPPVQVRFRGELIPDSSLVRGLMEIEFTNRTEDTLADIRMFTGVPIVYRRDSTTIVEPPNLLLDSMLYRGVPLSETELKIDGRTIIATLPQPLKPGERAFFIMTFTTQMNLIGGSDGVVYTGWYPKVAAYHDGRWYTPTDSLIDQAAPSFADYQVSIGVDSVWHLVYPGELVNNKEHYGLLPPEHNDSIYVDIVHQHQQSYAGKTYKPTFEGGKKNYFIRSNNDIDFSIVAQQGLLRDRAYVDSLTIEVCYPPELADVWAGFVAAEAAKLVRASISKFGPLPFHYLRIVPTNHPLTTDGSPQIITLPDDLQDRDELKTALATQVSRCWR